MQQDLWSKIESLENEHNIKMNEIYSELMTEQGYEIPPWNMKQFPEKTDGWFSYQKWKKFKKEEEA